MEDPNGIAPTLYFVPIVDIKKLDCGTEATEPIKNIQGQTIAQMCGTDYTSCVKQGTCLVNETSGLRMINFTTRRGKIPLFSDKIKKECPYGLGLKDICLDPYFTIAADLTHHKLGEVIYIPTVKGLRLPNGEEHEGYFIVRDSGTNLKSDKRFDFFTGFDVAMDSSNEFKKLGLGDKNNRFKFEIASEDVASKVRTQRNYPKLNSKQRAEATEYLRKIIKN